MGTVLFLLGGLFLIIASFIWTVETSSKIIGLILGLFLFLLSVLTIIKQSTDKVQIKDNILRFQLNLKRRNIPLDGSEKVKMKSEVVKINRVGTMGSEFIIITHLLITQNQETPIFQFQMDNSYSEKAFKLGTELTRIFNLAFRSF